MSNIAITAVTVPDMLRQLRGIGLDVRKETGSGHWKIHDPKSGAWLFNVSSSPSDTNWHWAVKRHLRRLGLLYTNQLGTGKKGKKKAAIDMDALARAQAQAAAHGAHVPTLEDLEDSTEFFSRLKIGGATSFSAEAQEETIGIMSTASSPRMHHTKSRLAKFLVDRKEELERRASERAGADGKRPLGAGKGSRAEFVRIAVNEVAPARGIRAWTSVASGEQTLYNLEKNPETNLSIWVANLLEATMDHIEGLKWSPKISAPTGAKRPEPTPVLAVVPDALEYVPGEASDTLLSGIRELHDEILALAGTVGSDIASLSGRLTTLENSFDVLATRPDPVAAVLEVTEPNLRERYADVLLRLVETSEPNVVTAYLDRLDKLVGLE